MGERPSYESIEAPHILYEDRQVIVVHKPSGWLSQPDDTGDPCVAQWLVELLRERRKQDGEGLPAGSASPEHQPSGIYNPFVAPVHRLDRPVSGVLAMARTSKAAARLTAQFATREVRKVYLAVVEAVGRPLAEQQVVTLLLSKDRTANRVEWKPVPSSGAPLPGWDLAVTEVRRLAESPTHLLVELSPHTGRPHQLRATMAYLGHPIVGDVKYGSSAGLGPKIALHAHTLTFQHPTQHTEIQVISPTPSWWTVLFPGL